MRPPDRVRTLVGGADIDRARLFLPEALTPLFHTPVYAEFTSLQRCRYNQLHAVYTNEQILFFEETLAANILTAVLRTGPPPPLGASLDTFLDDEAAHTRMFRAFNRRCAPDLYAGRDFYFVRVSPLASRLLTAASRHPHALPLFVWLMLLLEERAVHYAKQILRSRDTLEPCFVAIHRTHLADEVRHVRWDQELLDLLWREAGPLRRRANAILFRWMVGEFFNVPKRAGVRVVDELVRQCPELTPRLPAMRAQLRDLARNTAYHLSLYARPIVPKTFGRFRRVVGVSRTAPRAARVRAMAEAGTVKTRRFPIPAPLNLLLGGCQVSALLGILAAAARLDPWWCAVLLAPLYGIAMNSAYSLLHEAEHNIFHPNPVVNDVAGVALALFFPSSRSWRARRWAAPATGPCSG